MDVRDLVRARQDREADRAMTSLEEKYVGGAVLDEEVGGDDSLTTDELSLLLRRRESRGREQGWRRGYDAGRQHGLQLAHEDAREWVVAALGLVLAELEPAVEQAAVAAQAAGKSRSALTGRVDRRKVLQQEASDQSGRAAVEALRLKERLAGLIGQIERDGINA